MDLPGMKETETPDEQPSEQNELVKIFITGMENVKKKMGELETRCNNLEVYIGELATAAEDEETLVTFLQETSERAQALRVKIGSNGENKEETESDESEDKTSQDSV